MKITRFTLTEVVVPARPDSVNSPEHDHPLHQLAYAGQPAWSVQFDEMPKVIVEMETDTGITGLGEVYRGVGIDVLEPIARSLLDASVYELPLQALPIPVGRAYDGFELAICDAATKAMGVPLHRLLGGAVRDRVRCGYWTGHRTVADASRKAKEGQDAGFDCIKFKCGLDDPVDAWCAAIRDACGEQFKVILDPNRRWETVANTIERANALEPIGNVLCLEDPIPRDDYAGFAQLRRDLEIPIAIHVAIPYGEMGQHESDTITALQHDCCDLFNFNGGLFGVKRMAAAAALADRPFWHGSEVDLGPLEASYVHKAAACPNCTLPSDIFGRLVREHDLLDTPLAFDDTGHALVPDGPGLGVALDRDALDHYTTQRWEITL
ncbi:MAG: enolase C-terminal domain-like protein [Planctomycetota bacterium]